MPELDRFIPGARVHEVDHIDVAAPPARAYEALRHLDLGRSPLVRRLFALRTFPERLGNRRAPQLDLRLDAITASGDGFRLLYDEPGRAFAVGAIGRFWEPDIPYADVAPDAFAAFAEPGFAKVAWEIRLEPIGDTASRVTLDLRVAATDDVSRRSFRRYFRAVGPFSRFLRRHLLASIEAELGALDRAEADGPLPGDERIPNARAQSTHGITIEAPPDAVWPWLVQMGRGRAGWYSYDWLDNGGVPSATTIRPELQDVRVGDELPATPDGREGFVVDRLEPGRLLLLHAVYDVDRGHRVHEGEPRPDNPWEVSWAFVLEPIGDHATRLVVRARVDYDPERSGPRAVALGSVHHFMEAEQLRNLKRRAEGRVVPHGKHVDTARDVGDGIVGALGMLLDFGTPFRRRARSRWGLTAEEAARARPGDERIPEPRWGWTHAIDVAAPAPEVWPWLAQIGQEKAGFYSYQWLENLAGCDIQNADRIHPEWQRVRVGDTFRIHPAAPPLTVLGVEPGQWLLVGAGVDGAGANATPGVHVTWLFAVEPLGPRASRVVSRYRVTYEGGVRERLLFGPALIESIGFEMDRRMLRGIQERVEREAAATEPTRRSA